MRHVILHYHLFKNAGTSLDRVLQRNFGAGWLTAEFPSNQDNTALVSQWITDHPDAVCFSSHTLRGPMPDLRGVTIVPILFLRDPIARIVSAYHFERSQQAQTLGAQLAKKHDLDGYVRSRLAIRGDRQCRNFQTSRLASLTPGPNTEAQRARQAVGLIRKHGVLGMVAQFDAALVALRRKIAPVYPSFNTQAVRANVSPAKNRQTLSPELQALLRRTNAEDFALLDFVNSSQRVSEQG